MSPAKFNSPHDSIARGYVEQTTRRHFLQDCSLGLASMWLGSQSSSGSSTALAATRDPHAVSQMAGKAKRVIFLHMAGAPSQLELFDYKPDLEKLDGLDCPDSFLAGKRFAFIQGVPKMLGPQARFSQHGESGAWVSERLPHFQSVVDLSLIHI